MKLVTDVPLEIKAGVYAVHMHVDAGDITLKASINGLTAAPVNTLDTIDASGVYAVALPECTVEATLAGANQCAVEFVGK